MELPSPLLSAASLRSIISLVEKREKLVTELAQLDATISEAFVGGVASPKAEKTAVVAPKVKDRRSPKKRKSSGRRGTLKEAILSELQEAGKSGVVVQDLAEKLGVKSASVQVWFYTTGKTIGVKKLGPGKYAL